MPRRMVALLGASLAVLAIGAPTASAADAGALPYCYGATYGTSAAQVCVADSSVIGNGTIDPQMSTDCIVRLPSVVGPVTIGGPVITAFSCKIVGNAVSSVGTTGFEPGGQPIPTPYLQGLQVHLNGFYVGTLYVNGQPTGVQTEHLCVGGGCPVTTQLVTLT